MQRAATSVFSSKPRACTFHEKLMGQVPVPARCVTCEFEALPQDAQQLRELLSSVPSEHRWAKKCLKLLPGGLLHLRLPCSLP